MPVVAVTYCVVHNSGQLHQKSNKAGFLAADYDLDDKERWATLIYPRGLQLYDYRGEGELRSREKLEGCTVIHGHPMVVVLMVLAEYHTMFIIVLEFG